jgi:hypothetical protein
MNAQTKTIGQVSAEAPLIPEFLTEAPGVKYDIGKLRFDLIPPRVMQELAEVYTMGAEKYEPRNWELGIEYSRLYSAVQRHLHCYWTGQNLDEESGLPHLAHAMWGIAALLEFERTHPEMDDRP